MYSSLMVGNENGSFKKLGFGVEIIDSLESINAKEKKVIENIIWRNHYNYQTINNYEDAYSAINFIGEKLKKEYKLDVDSLRLKRNIYEFSNSPEIAGVKIFQSTDI